MNGAEDASVQENESTEACFEEAEPALTLARMLGIDAADTDELLDAVRTRIARAELSEMLRQRNALRTYRSMLSESNELSEKIEGFDLSRELSDKRFVSMLKAGLSISDAWRAVHIDSLIEEAREAARAEAFEAAYEKLSVAKSRPFENGAGGRAPAKSQQSVESLTGKGIRDILRRVENGAKIKF